MEAQSGSTSLPGEPSSDRRPQLSGAEGVKWATGHVDAGNQASHGNNATGRSFKLRTQYRFGTWNVRGLNEDGKLPILEKELERCKLTITGLSETHWKNSGHFDSEKHTIYFSGSDTSSHSGVAIAIPKVWNGAVLGYHPVSDRIISIKLSASPTPLNIIQVYAPTYQALDETVEVFYNQLETTMAKVPKRELLLIIGDFNSKVGATTMDDGIRNIVGKYGLGVRNKRGERLIEFAANHNLTIMNTTFKHHPRRLFTWTQPGDRARNQIDYILVRSRWRSSITNTHTLPGADCGSDHELLVGNLRIKLQRARATKVPRRIQVIDKSALISSIESKHSTWRTEIGGKDSNLLWISTKKCVLDALTESQPVKRSAKRQHWMAPNTWQLVEERRLLKSSGASGAEINAKKSAIQAACRRDRNDSLAKICDDLEQHSVKLQTKDLHDKVRLITRQFKPKTWAIENTAGITVTEIKDIVKVWKDYCKSLFTNNYASDDAVALNHIVDREPSVLRDEVRAAIRHLKCNKAVGVDEIPIEVFKAMGETGLGQEGGVDFLHNICCKIWDTGIWPEDWSQSIFIPLHKKGSTKKCNNYRLISLISHASKVLLHILNTRLQGYLNQEIAPEQAGFVKGRGTREQILILRQIIEKSREFCKPIFICFVDFRKAFDTVTWENLWKILLEMGVPHHLVFLVKRLYEDGNAAVRVDNVLSENFKTKSGVRQGCILSPLLFNIYTEYIMRIVLEGWEKGVSVGGRMINNLRYADDTTLLAQSKEELEELLIRLETISIQFGLALNRDKTKVMIVDRTGVEEAGITSIANCDVVQNYIYLGSTITNQGGCTDEIKRRCAITRSAVERLGKIWKDRRITKNTKVRLMKCLVFPIFLYGAETWSLKLIDRRKIDALEMWCWRRLLKIPWTAFRTNNSILRELKIRERLSSIVQLRIMKFFGHISRNEDSMERLVVQGRVEGKRSRGHSPTRWTDLIVKATDRSIVKCTRDTTNRKKWRQIARRAAALGNDMGE